jgi:hypothetical protein
VRSVALSRRRLCQVAAVPNLSPLVHDALEQDSNVARRLQGLFGPATQVDHVFGIWRDRGKLSSNSRLLGMSFMRSA